MLPVSILADWLVGDAALPQDFMAANHKKHLQQEREQRQKLAAAAAQRQRIKELAAQQREVS
jgi:hypothetical protein